MQFVRCFLFSIAGFLIAGLGTMFGGILIMGGRLDRPAAAWRVDAQPHSHSYWVSQAESLVGLWGVVLDSIDALSPGVWSVKGRVKRGKGMGGWQTVQYASTVDVEMHWRVRRLIVALAGGTGRRRSVPSSLTGGAGTGEYRASIVLGWHIGPAIPHRVVAEWPALRHQRTNDQAPERHQSAQLRDRGVLCHLPCTLTRRGRQPRVTF